MVNRSYRRTFAEANKILPLIVKKLTSPALGALLAGGIFAAVMSSLDAQFLSLGSMFTNDIVAHYSRKDRFGEKQLVLIGRLFIVAIVAISYWLGLELQSKRPGCVRPGGVVLCRVCEPFPASFRVPCTGVA